MSETETRTLLWTEATERVEEGIPNLHYETSLSDEIEWTPELAAECLKSVMSELSQLPLNPLEFQTAIMGAMVGLQEGLQE